MLLSPAYCRSRARRLHASSHRSGIYCSPWRISGGSLPTGGLRVQPVAPRRNPAVPRCGPEPLAGVVIAPRLRLR
jgi:hypothetical protein